MIDSYNLVSKAGLLVTAIIGTMFFFYFVGAVIPTLNASGNGFNDTNLCINDGYFYNSTNHTCYQSASDSTHVTPPTSQIPLLGFLTPQGALFKLILMVVLLGGAITLLYFKVWKGNGK